ncbi:MAG: GGDEF domain-containing protein [Nitrospira sp.]|nr:GGDEF domain-containing protein [Nitrospira sp.]
MHSSRPELNTSNDRNGSDSTNQHGWPDDEAGTQSLQSARLGVAACILFMAGGLYWTASVGLLTLSALMAYPVMISAGILLTLLVFGATFWTPRGPQSASRMHALSEESNGSGMHTYDSVTGLPTYRLFTSLLKQAQAHADKHGRPVAVLMIELDHFTPKTDEQAQINLNLMYRVLAARVKSALRTTDTVARLAERTFVVLLDQVTGSEEVLAIARKMQSTISLPVTLDGHELFLTSRIGIGLSSHDTVESDGLLDAATRAMARARTEGYALNGLPGAMASTSVDPTSTIAA